MITQNTNDVDDRIHEYNGRYYFATWSESAGQFQGPVTSKLRTETGWSGFMCRSEKGLPGAGGYSYKSLSGARRAIKKYLEF